MSDLWTRWREHHAAHGIDPTLLCEDGPIVPRLYARADPRIVFLLRDTNDYVGGLSALLADGPRYQMWHTVARWAAGLLSGFPPFEDIDRQEPMKVALQQVAVVNLKKTKGRAQAVDAEIEEHMERDREFLFEQIIDLRAKVLVAAGTFGSVLRLIGLDDPTYVHSEAPVLSPGLDAWVLKTRHPNRADNRKTYEELKRWWERRP